MEDRKITREQFDEAVIKVATEAAAHGLQFISVDMILGLYALLYHELFHKEELNEAEEALRKAVDSHDSQH